MPQRNSNKTGPLRRSTSAVAVVCTPSSRNVHSTPGARKAIGSDEMKRFLEGEGAEGAAMSAKAFRELIESEVKRWDKVAKDANIRAD